MEAVKICAMVMIVSSMLGAGMQVDWQRVVETLREYGLLAKAFLANFVLVPLYAIILVRVFHVETGIATGILLMSMAPGVPFLVNSAGRKPGGSLSLALTIAFCFTAISVVTIPFMIQFVLPLGADAHVPAAKFITTLLLFQLLPLIVGALIGPRLAPPLDEKVTKILHLIFLVAALVFLVLAFPMLVHSVSSVYGFGNLLIIAAIALLSVATGWLLGGPQDSYRRTLSIATLMRNIGLCAMIGTSEIFAGTLVVPAILSYFIITFLISLPIRMYFGRTKDAGAPA